jgi:3-oxoacyl-[acyl-carrier protein] reductase
MISLKGKTALVTGATGGIGEAITVAMHAAGAKVIMTGRRKDKLDELTYKLGENAYALQADLADESQVASLFDKAEELVGHVDILVCNAGITNDTLSIRMSDEQWNQVINVNLTAVFKLNQTAVSKMMRRRYGRIINITSVVGATGNAGQANYTAAKAGVTGMTKSIAREMASRNITLNCIAPGFIETAMTEVLMPEVKEATLAQIPMKRMGNANEIAHAAVFLASDMASYITGHTLHVNGGMFMA